MPILAELPNNYRAVASSRKTRASSPTGTASPAHSTVRIGVAEVGRPLLIGGDRHGTDRRDGIRMPLKAATAPVRRVAARRR